MAVSMMICRLYFIFHPVRHSSWSMQSFNKMTMSDQLVIVLFKILVKMLPLENVTFLWTSTDNVTKHIQVNLPVNTNSGL